MAYASFFTGEPSPAPGEQEPSKPYRLLIVDDEPNVLKALQRVFRQEAYQVMLAASGDEALRICAQEAVHVVISDYMMPGMNGAELLRRIKQTWPDTIRIMLTGHADTGAVMGAINEGAVFKFILKPWNDDDLRVTVALALEQHDLIHKNRSLQEENRLRSREVKRLSRLAASSRSQLAIMLHKRGLLNDQQLQELHQQAQQRKQPIIRVLLDKGWIAEDEIRKILRKDLLLEEVSLAEYEVVTALHDLFPRSFCEHNLIAPLKLEGKLLTLVMADPMDTGLIDDLRFSAGLELRTVMANSAAITERLDALYGERSETGIDELESLVATVDPYESIEVVIEEEDDLPLDELLRQSDELPAVRLVNAIILEAARLKASDVHIQPRAKGIVVRYRIDGILRDTFHIPHHMQNSLVSRIKIMSELDIAEKRRPQDGRITVKTPMHIVDLRISTLPTVSGEKVVMRILDRNASIQSLNELGFAPQELARVRALTEKPQGIILATGPTGSGKTNTLYSLLQHNADPGKNYVTIEDPVEFFMDMAGQVHIREKIGLTFPSVLRAILRQDPDVILLGEIRDFETAEVAFHAALTGHMVFSTLHTNSAVATVARLFDLGLKPYVVAAALEGIIAQRLVRRLCSHCREPTSPEAELAEKLGPGFSPANLPQSYRAKGCRHCGGSGYHGRIGLFEVLVPNDELRHLMTNGASMLEINRAARAQGTRSLLTDAQEKVAQGLTDCREVLRVLGPQANELSV